MIGQTIASYRIEALLGEGGMGSVYRAVDINLGRPIALKLMHPHLARQPEFRDRFIQEARSAANLSHPSIVRIYQFEANGDVMFIAMEFFPGGTLTGHLRRVQTQKQLIDLRESLAILAQIAEALDYAHRRGVVHRDIKPDNILLAHLEQPERTGEPPLRAVITDFGLAKLRTGAAVQTQDGTFMGTLPYMSPEQCLGKELDGRTDIYALGVMLYQMTTNRLPFDVKTPSEALLKHINEPPPPPRDFSPNLPEIVVSIILKCLAKDPAQRFTTASDLAVALRSTAASLTEDQVTSYAPPAAIAHLNTQMMPGQPEQRGQSVFAGGGPPSNAAETRLQITTGDATTGRLMPFTGPSLVIGRDRECALVLEDNRASRQHARIDFDGHQYTITDLNSTNGTFLSGAQLLPGIPEVWPVEKVLQIGDSFLRILPARPGGDNSPVNQPMPGAYGGPPADSLANGPTGGMSAYRAAPGSPSLSARVGMSLAQNEVSLEPGQPASISINLFNQGTIVDHFKLLVEGLPLDWLPTMPPQVQLMPGAQQQINLTVQPPRTPQARAGSYPVTLRAASQDNPNQVVSARLNVVVKPYSQFTTELFPQRVRAGRNARLTVKNSGNAGQTFLVDWTDRGDELIFEPQKTQLAVAEGQSAVVDFRARPKQRAFVGGDQAFNFTTRVTSPQGDTQTQAGELVSRAVVPVWLIPILASLCVCLGLLAGGAAMGGRGLLGFLSPATATITPAAQGAVDTDGDGLTDVDELSLGTSINLKDTDQDGISDFDEVQQSLDPLKPNQATPPAPGENTATPALELTPSAQAVTPTETPAVANPLVIRLTRPNPGDYQPARDELVFQVIAYDPQSGSSDGDGIEAVNFEFFDSGGAKVYENRESNASYCSFQGGEPDCNLLHFIRANKQWPNGAPIFNGDYRLVATAFAPDGRSGQLEFPFSIQLPPARVVYTSDRNGGQEIFVRNLENNTDTNLTNNTSASDVNPVWSPDGRFIAFQTFRDGDTEIYVMNADGSSPRNLSNASSSSEYEPAWTADGRYVAYSSDRLGDLDIFITSVNDGSTFQMTYDGDSEYQPAFSPDGQTMAFISDRGSGQPDLFVMEFDIETAKRGEEGRVRDFYSSSDSESSPDWSPDSKFIAFASGGVSDNNIYIMEFDGTPVAITSSSFYEFEPVWMPDGRRVVFTQTESYGTLFVVFTDGSDARPFFENTGYSNGSADLLP